MQAISIRAWALLLLCVFCPLGLSESQTIVRDQRMVVSGPSPNVLPAWSGGALLTIYDSRTASPVLKAFDKDGNVLAKLNISIPGAGLINIYPGQFARGLDGSLALCGSAFTNDRRGTTFLLLVSPDAKRQIVLRDPTFKPLKVTVAEDGTIWVAGREFTDEGEGDPNHLMIRRFSPDGKLLGGLLPRSSITLHATVSHPVPTSHLQTSSRGVAWYSPASRDYFEFDNNGKLLLHVPTPAVNEDNQTSQGFAFCDAGDAFIRVNTQVDGMPLVSQLLRLNRSTKAWDVVRENPAMGHIYGCQGSTLIMMHGGSSGITLADVSTPE